MSDELDKKPEEEMDGGPEETPETPPEPSPEASTPLEEMALGSTSEFDGEVTDDDKLWALLAYIFSPLIPIVILLMADKKERPYLKAHNGQALVVGVVNFIVSVTISPFLCGLPSLAILIASIYWGIQAYQGNKVEIPFITDFVKNQGWA